MDPLAFVPFRRTKSQHSLITGTGPSNSRSLFGRAFLEYKNLTREDLLSNPLASRLKNCNSPATILPVLKEQARALGQPRSSDESSTQLRWLESTVNVLYHLSQGLEDRAGLLLSPAEVIFVGIGVLLPDLDASQDAIIETFESTESLLRRLAAYIKIQPTTSMMDMNEQIMSTVLSILASVTEEIRQGRTKKYWKKLPVVRKSGIEDALRTLDKLTQEMAKTVGNSDLPSTPIISSGVSNTATQQQDGIQRWLLSSDPSKNYSVALKSRHEGTAQWVLQNDTFTEWKSTGSFLWVTGKPGSGKSVLCAAIIEDIEVMCKSVPASMAYFVFDFNDDHKQSCHDMTTSLLTQLSAQSKPYHDILFRLYSGHNRGSRTPSSRVVTECLKEMLSLPDQGPVYIILDAIDECPNTRGLPSPREEILGLVKELLESGPPNLRLCVTCRRECDISSVLDPLNPFRLSLQDEPGQKADIVKYVTDIVHWDLDFRMWRNYDKKLVIETLSERADGMFLWVSCQVDHLRHSLPLTMHHILNEFPATLDGMYERILTEINITKRIYAHRLFHCLTVAIRPLRIEELAEILATNFDDGEATPEIKIDWKREDPEQAVLSVCSSLVEVVNLDGSKVVQFSHPSVKDFLTSDHLAASRGRVSRYRVDLELAHTILARACLNVLLHAHAQLDPDNYPLVEYAARYWVDHVRFENVASYIQDKTKQLFDPEKPYFENWVKIYDMDKIPGSPTSRPTQPNTAPLYYAILCDLPDLAEYLIGAHPQCVGVRGGQSTMAIHAALYRGHFSIARLLIEKSEDVNSRDDDSLTPLHIAAQRGYFAPVALLHSIGADASARKPDHSPSLFMASKNARDDRTPTSLHLASVTENLKTVQLLIERGADLDAMDVTQSTPLHLALVNENFDIVKLLIQHGADVNVPYHKELTPLHLAAVSGSSDVIKLILQKTADINSQDDSKSTSLHLAADSGSLEVVRLLLDYEANVNARDNKRSTPLHLASRRGSFDLVQLLLERGADPNAQNEKGWTALHIASQKGAVKVVQCLLERGANANIGDGDGRTPLHVASSTKNTKIVALLMECGADPSVQDTRKLTPFQFETTGPSACPSGMQRTSSARSDSSSGPGSRPADGH